MNLCKHMSVLVVIATAAVGCAAGVGKNFRWDQVRQLKVGMSQDEVSAIMGSPSNSTSYSDGRLLWQWIYTDTMWSGEQRHATVLFRDGKAVSVPDVPADWK